MSKEITIPYSEYQLLHKLVDKMKLTVKIYHGSCNGCVTPILKGSEECEYCINRDAHSKSKEDLSIYIEDK